MRSGKTVQDINAGQSKEENLLTGRTGMVWQKERNRRSRARFDPFAMLVLLCLIISIACLLWFGWKYYTLKHEVARLSELVVTLMEEKSTQPPVNLSDQQEPANKSLPGAPETQTAASSAKSTMYTIQDGDNWWEISEKFYGLGSYYPKLTVYNKMQNQRLYKGLVVEIPPREILDAL